MTVLLEGTDEPPRKRTRLCSFNNSQPGLCSFNNSQPVAVADVNVPSNISRHMATPLEAGVMMNGYALSDTLHHHNLKSCSPDESPSSENQSPVATLCNLGNTCFLNSVLYTLRFAPFFLHNLHHLTEDLKQYSGRHPQIKTKSSSLGRGIGSGSKSWSSKDLLSLGGDTTHTKIQLATERLHDLYESLHNAEQKDHVEAFQPEVFLHALRDVNPIFEGNQQHDAHELLVCLLDNIRETCSQLSKVVAASERQRSSSTVASTAVPPPRPPPVKQSWSGQVRKSLKLNKVRIEKGINNGIKKKHNSDLNLINGTPETETNGVLDGHTEDQVDKEQQPAVGHNFIAEDFEGVSLLRTTCLECEQITERKETFCDICVPINSAISNSNNNISSPAGEQDYSRMYREAVVTEEYLHESNKYWCEQCLRYNEAKRSVRYESLPRLLTLQLKRFSSSYGSVVSKVIDHMPTPLTLSCFCEECIQSENHSPHRYELFGVIMHLGATMASGHYVAYVRGRDTLSDYEHCTRDKRKTASLSGASGKLSNPDAKIPGGSILRYFKSNKSTNGSTGVLNDTRPFLQSCRSAECCGVKLRNEESSSCNSESNWLECDDDTVRTITKSQLEEILTAKNSKNSALTPYLLFYVRSPQ